ncbi:hypothetical protein Q5P01_017003 [Channa striata]|uniref:SEA domain-containing protein n=1 Tax=Channa striata TaxID=64152 RepID=A0AA88M9Y3_CHASR|nr:hypothetical protein Q5P01_017003 [Channa striata]
MFATFLPVVLLLAAVDRGMTENNTTENSTISDLTTGSTITTLTTHTSSDTTTTAPTTHTVSTNTTPTAGPSPTSSTSNSTGNTTTLRPSTTTSREITTLNMTESPTGNTTASLTSTVTATTTRTTEVTTTNSTTSAQPILVCPAVPCPVQSVCLNGTCQCLSGSYLLNGLCVSAQVFPGQLHLNLNFNAGMRNRSSEIFQSTAAKISAALSDALKSQSGYIRSDVVQLEPGSVLASVNNIFENSDATPKSIDDAINKTIAESKPGGLLAGATYAATNLCEQEPLPCEVSTTTCRNKDGRAVCFCKEGFISVVYSNTSCRACPSGQRAVGDTCQPCAFGYSGFNCNDSALLAVVVISCVLGGILLILILALLIYCCCIDCSKDNANYGRSPYSSGEIAQTWPTGVTTIPRATTNWDPSPPMEMTEGGSTHALVDKKHQTNGLSGSYDVNPETMKTFKGSAD